MDLYKSIAEIVDTGKLVLFDTCSTGVLTDTFFESLYDVRRFHHIDRDAIALSTGLCYDFLELLNSPNLETVSDVCNEMLDGQELLADKLSYLNRKEQITFRIKRGYAHETVPSFEEELLSKLLLAYSQLVRHVRYSLVNPCPAFYKPIERVVTNLNEQTPKHHDNNSRKRHGVWNADSQLVAAAFYYYRYESKDVVIVTLDEGILKLSAAFHELLAERTFPANSASVMVHLMNPRKDYEYDFDVLRNCIVTESIVTESNCLPAAV